MSQRNILLGFLALAVIAQLTVPISMIAKHERTLREGEPFRFQTAPVDPVDVFRGRYVTLRFVVNEAPEIPGVGAGDRFYARLGTDAKGFASVTETSLEPPGEGAYLELRTSYNHDGLMHFELPFDRYYMPEHLAPAAERAYAEFSSSEPLADGVRGADRELEPTAYVRVRVRQGLGLIEDLFIGDRSVREYLEETGN